MKVQSINSIFILGSFLQVHAQSDFTFCIHGYRSKSILRINRLYDKLITLEVGKMPQCVRSLGLFSLVTKVEREVSLDFFTELRHYIKDGLEVCKLGFGIGVNYCHCEVLPRQICILHPRVLRCKSQKILACILSTFCVSCKQFTSWSVVIVREYVCIYWTIALSREGIFEGWASESTPICAIRCF